MMKGVRRNPYSIKPPPLPKLPKVTSVVVEGQTWVVPRGFGAEYRRMAEDVQSKAASVIRDRLELIGYTADPEAIQYWPLRKRVEASVYAMNVHYLASDNRIQAHPKPMWLSIRPKVAVVTFVEGYFEDLMWFDNIATAKAFKQGFGMCSGHYGGTGQSYALPDDLDEMREDESDKYTSLKKGEVDKAIAMMERNNT